MTVDNGLLRYRRKRHTEVTAIRLNVDTDGFDYRKWGGIQRCKQGDWLVENDDDTYTVDANTFARTYKATGEGRYAKGSDIWAEIARSDGSIETKEGITEYKAGDYLVYNAEDRRDGYAITAKKFATLYELLDK